jgi:hypothetical protein
MTMPTEVTKRTVEWTLLDNGTPVPGIVLSFVPAARIINVAGVTTTVADVTATTDSAGKVSVQLVATDDVDTAPQLGKWYVTGTLVGNRIGGGFDVPSAGSGVINLASVVFTTQRITSGPEGLVTVSGAEDIVQAALEGFDGAGATITGGGTTVDTWATATAYTAGHIVSLDAKTYAAKDAHTSGGTFAGDLSAHWTLIGVDPALAAQVTTDEDAGTVGVKTEWASKMVGRWQAPQTDITLEPTTGAANLVGDTDGWARTTGRRTTPASRSTVSRTRCGAARSAPSWRPSPRRCRSRRPSGTRRSRSSCGTCRSTARPTNNNLCRSARTVRAGCCSSRPATAAAG